MKVQLMCAMALVGSAAFAAVPTVSKVRLAGGEVSADAVVTYDLDGAVGIVVVDVQTNDLNGGWASIGGKNIKFLTGAVNRLEEPGKDKQFRWHAKKSWPGHKLVAPEQLRVQVTAYAADNPPDYMVVDLTGAGTTYYPSVELLPEGIDSDVYRTKQMVFRRIHAAGVTWLMGSKGEVDAATQPQEAQHPVTFTEDYYMGVFEVTQYQFWQVFGGDQGAGCYFNNKDHWATRPKENFQFNGSICASGSAWGTLAGWPNVSYADAAEVTEDAKFVPNMRALAPNLGKNLYLPTEAQWEFACRAGTTTPLCCGAADAELLKEYGRFKDNGGKVGGTDTPARDCTTDNGTARVGSYKPNAWGLYDMHGNVEEFCLDYRRVNMPTEHETDPWGVSTTASDKGTCRVLRGGSWANSAYACRSAYRHNDGNDGQMWSNGSTYGFRMCVNIPQTAYPTHKPVGE